MKNKVLSLILALLLILSAVPMGAFSLDANAETSGIAGDCTWSLDGTVLTISGNGEMEDFLYSAPWGTSVTSIVIESGVTSIGKNAFFQCENLEDVTIPDTVKSIGDNAFGYCTSLKHIDIPNSVTSIGNWAFRYCFLITSVNIPYGVTRIGNQTFQNCNNLIDVTIPYGVTEIGYEAFYGCPITTIDIPNSVTQIGDGAFAECDDLSTVVIPSDITTINSYMFYGCRSLSSITLPDGVSSIGDYAFYLCNNLIDIVIPNSVTSISNNAFDGCDNLTIYGYISSYAETYAIVNNIPFVALDGNDNIDESYYTYTVTDGEATITAVDQSISGDVVIPNTLGGYPVTGIGDNAFHNCYLITNIIIPDGVKSIGEEAFYVCGQVEQITIPASVTKIGAGAMLFSVGLKEIIVDENNTEYCSIDGVLFNKSVTELIKYPEAKVNTEYTVPQSVTSVGDNAFFWCKNITDITLPDNITYIGYSAFSACDNLANIIIPSGVTSIMSGAFGNTSITDITIPDGIVSIGSNTFYECNDLVNIIIPSSVTNIGREAFYNCYNLTDVWYGGSAKDKENIVIDLHNEDIEKATWHYAEQADAHDFVYVDEVAPSCVDGTMAHYVCTDCGLRFLPVDNEAPSIYVDDSEAVSESELVIEATGHVEGVAVQENVIDATCAKTGSYDNVVYCEACGEEISREKVTTATDSHRCDSNGFCVDCQIMLLTYTISNDTVKITGCDDLLYGKVIIPSTIDGYPVTSIGARAFQKNLNVTEIILPDSITSIGSNAFNGCSNLVNLWLGNSVVTIGSSVFAYCTSLESIVIPDSVTTISGTAFGYNDSLKSVTFGKGITEIGATWFYRCGGLETIVIPDTITSIGASAFANCTALKSVIISDSVTTIGSNAFKDCTALSDVTLGIGVTSVGDAAFNGCTALSNIYYNGSVANRVDITVGASNDVFENANWNYAIVIDIHKFVYVEAVSANCVKSGVIAHYECVNCGRKFLPVDNAAPSIYIDNSKAVDGKELVIPTTDVHSYDASNSSCTVCGKVCTHNSGEDLQWVVTTYGDCVTINKGKYVCSTCGFASEEIDDPRGVINTHNINENGICTGCEKSLLTYTVSNGAVKITGCDASLVGGVIIPATIDGYPVTSIGAKAFHKNSNVTEIILPDSITSIGSNAFNGCSNLVNLLLGNGVVTIGSSVFAYCTSLESIVIPDSVTTISGTAFGYNDSLKSVTFGKGITEIGATWFYRCGGLETIVIPDTITSIGASAFENCTALKSIVIPESVTSIGSNAFEGCELLTDVYYGANKVAKEAIAIETSNTYLMNATWHYSYCKPGEHTYSDADDVTCENCDWIRGEIQLVSGDINGDGKINNRDLALLMQYLNDWIVVIHTEVADVNADGKINNKDYVLIERYINDWDIELK